MPINTMPKTREAFDRLEKIRLANTLAGDLAEFFRAAWIVLEPATPLTWSWHYDLICEWLKLIAVGQFKQRYPKKRGVIINVPPRTAKSTLVSAWMVWTWLTRPAARFLCASYSHTLSEDHSYRRRQLIESGWFQHLFGDRFALSSDRNRIDYYANDRTGYHIATSVGGTSTGLGGDICVGDDLLST